MQYFDRKKVLLKRLAGTVGLLLLSAYLFYTYQFTHLKNFRSVIPEVLYRSGQPDANDIKAWHSKYHIKNIINLRGDPGASLRSEVATKATELNIKTRYLRLSARHRPTKEKLQLIIDALNNSDRPLLIHCMGGVDRSGLVSTIALILKNYPVDLAIQQMSWSYGFLPFRKQTVLKEVVIEYQQWLDKNKMISTRDNFIFWAQNLFA